MPIGYACGHRKRVRWQERPLQRLAGTISRIAGGSPRVVASSAVYFSAGAASNARLAASSCRERSRHF